MHTARNTDDIVSDPASIPTQATQTPAAFTLIDVHLYDYTLVPEEGMGSVDSTLQEAEKTPPRGESDTCQQWQQQVDPHRKRPRWTQPLVFSLLVALCILAVMTGILTYITLFTPTAPITIIPQSEQVQTNGTITVVTGAADVTQDQVPGRTLSAITMSQSHTQAATGWTEQAARLGRGTVTFYNAALSPQTIAAGTLLTGADGIQVATDAAVTVPPVNYPTLGSATVTAHAVEPGTVGNIKAGDIYGACCLVNISAVNGTFSGGEAAQSYQSVAQADIDSTTASLKTSLIQALAAALQTQVRSTETLVTPPACQPTVTADRQPGDKATQVEVTVSESCTGITYDTGAFQRLVTQAQTQAAGEQQRAGYRLSGEAQASIERVTPGSVPGTETLTVQSTGTWVYQFSQKQLSRMAASITGKTTQQATQILLHTPGVGQVSMSNAGSPLPSDRQKIHFLMLIKEKE